MLLQREAHKGILGESPKKTSRGISLDNSGVIPKKSLLIFPKIPKNLLTGFVPQIPRFLLRTSPEANPENSTGFSSGIHSGILLLEEFLFQRNLICLSSTRCSSSTSTVIKWRDFFGIVWICILLDKYNDKLCPGKSRKFSLPEQGSNPLSPDWWFKALSLG